MVSTLSELKGWRLELRLYRDKKKNRIGPIFQKIMANCSSVREYSEKRIIWMWSYRDTMEEVRCRRPNGDLWHFDLKIMKGTLDKVQANIFLNSYSKMNNMQPGATHFFLNPAHSED